MALILVRPHTSLLDGPAVALYLRRMGIKKAVFAVDPGYARHPVWKRLLNAYGWFTGLHMMLPLDTSRPFALRTFDKLLKEGRTVVIFPQGTGIGDAGRPDAKGVNWLIHRQGCLYEKSVLAYKPLELWLNHDHIFPRVLPAIPEHYVLNKRAELCTLKT